MKAECCLDVKAESSFGRLFYFYCHFSVIACESGILIFKLNLIGKAVKAESEMEKRSLV